MILGSELVKFKNIPSANFLTLISVITLRLRLCKVRDFSMEPNINHNDFLAYRPIKRYNCESLIGNVVIANHPIKANTKIVKRVKYEAEEGVWLLGDNKNMSEDSRKYGLVPKENICGVVERIARNTKYLSTIFKT
tara:strand:- start:561 stop:968 length:408 start_codon:yes stop_codon:yes gene_type:complete